MIYEAAWDQAIKLFLAVWFLPYMIIGSSNA